MHEKIMSILLILSEFLCSRFSLQLVVGYALVFRQLFRHQLGKLSDNVARFSESKAATVFGYWETTSRNFPA